MFFLNIGCAVFIMFLSSCSAHHSIQSKAKLVDESVIVSPYSIVCIIHGDGDYLYHDTNGNEHLADEDALAKAKKVALQNPFAEVFIFHQRPSRHFLFIFPLRDGEFYYYRNGKLIANEMYWREEEQSNLLPELELYQRFSPNTQNKKVSNIFLYCGHEIPEYSRTGYDASYPDRMFTVNNLAGALKNFTQDSSSFDLLILSTCFGGTPYTIGTLSSKARTIVASPDNLHLTYFDLYPLERLDLNLRDGNVPAFANRFAIHAFNRLINDIQTSVSVAVYNVDSVQEYLHSVNRVYYQSLTTLNEKIKTTITKIEHCDCAYLPAYILPTMKNGVKVFYRSSHFGRLKHKQNHSGWECLREAGKYGVTVQTDEPVSK